MKIRHVTISRFRDARWHLKIIEFPPSILTLDLLQALSVTWILFSNHPMRPVS